MSRYGIVERAVVILRKQQKWMTVQEIAMKSYDQDGEAGASSPKSTASAIAGTLSKEISGRHFPTRLVRRKSGRLRRQYEYGLPEWV